MKDKNIDYILSKKITIGVIIIIVFFLIDILNNYKIISFQTYKENGKTYKVITVEIESLFE